MKANTFVTVLSSLSIASHAWVSPPRFSQRPTTHRKDMLDEVQLLDFDELPSAPIVVIAALSLGAAAQTFINGMLEGDQGLAAFLKDGSGYNRSGFKGNSPAQAKKDPLPWMSLPKLDFVEVAGQETSLQKLERLRDEMNELRDEGLLVEADEVRKELERLCEEEGYEYTPME